MKEKIKKDVGFTGILIRISAVGATIGRPYKKFGRDVVFSADLCYNGISEEPPLCKENLWMRSCIFRGMGFALCLCNTKAKLAIIENEK